MKAVIADLDGQRAAALCEDGSVREVKNLDYSLGQEILIEEEILTNEQTLENGQRKSSHNRTAFRKWYRNVAAAAVVVLMLTGIGGASVYAMPYGEVSLDAGSSVTYTINRFDYVISAQANDEAGAQILEEVGEKNLVNHKVETAVAVTLDHMQQEEGSEADVEYRIRTDIGSDENGADDAHAQKLQKKLEKVLAEKVPEKTDHDPEGMDEVPLDENPEGTAGPDPSEPTSTEGWKEMQEEPEGGSLTHPEEGAGSEEHPENNMENMKENAPEGSENMLQDGTEGDSPEVPQGQFEEQPEQRQDDLPREQPQDSMGKPGEAR